VAASLIREARLRPESAHLYPGVPAGIWLPASEVGATLLMQHLRARSAPSLGNRLLDDAHFEFRGGLMRGGVSELRTRYGENGAVRPVS